MKKYLLIFSLLFTLNSYAQTSRTVTKIDENTIVKDTGGYILPYAIWQKLMQTGEYNLRRIEGTSEFVAYQMNAEEKARAEARKKAQMTTMPKPRQADSFKEGEKFRGEKITDINGNKYDLKTLSDKIYVINFWRIDSLPSVRIIPQLNNLVDKYKENKNVVFIAIALENKTQLKDFLQTNPFSYNIIEDGKNYAQKYSVSAYPTHVIVGKDGLIKFSTVGLAINTVYWVDKTIEEQLK